MDRRRAGAYGGGCSEKDAVVRIRPIPLESTSMDGGLSARADVLGTRSSMSCPSTPGSPAVPRHLTLP